MGKAVAEGEAMAVEATLEFQVAAAATEKRQHDKDAHHQRDG
jgi:hypothetical protein